MEEIYDLAIVLIYPDGYVEKTPIRKDKDAHTEYYYESLQEYYTRFARLVRERHFKFDWINEYNTYPILKFLVEADVIVIFNIDIAFVNMNEDYKKSARFEICVPDNYLEHSGINYLKNVVNFLGDNKYVINKLYDGYFDEIDDYSSLLDNKSEEKKI